MFFIFIALGIITAIILLLLLLKIDLIIEAKDKEAKLFIKVLHLIVVIRRKYEARREHGDILTLYSVEKNEKRILSLLDIIKTISKPREPRSNEKARGKLAKYINSKAAYKLIFNVVIGTEDAFATAMLCGIVQSVAGSLVCFIKDKRHKIMVSVVPSFGKRSFSFAADCIITLPLANIIIGYIIYKKTKGGDQYASDRKYHANSDE